MFPVADFLAAGRVPYRFVTGYGPAGLRGDDLDRPIPRSRSIPEQIVRTIEHWRLTQA